MILGLSRWGTNIGSSPLFLTDVLIFLGLCNWFIFNLRTTPPVGEEKRVGSPTLSFTLLFGFVIFRSLFSLENGPLLDWIRDAAPFFYAFLAFVSSNSARRATQEARKRTAQVFMVALTFHLLWVIGITLTESRGFNSPLGAAPLFEMRPDIDGAILGIGAGMFLMKGLREQKRLLPLLAVSASVACVLLNNSRAALVSAALSITIAFLLHYVTTKENRTKRARLQLIIPVAVVALLVVLPLTAPGQRVLATIDKSQAHSEGQINALGTERARQLVWSQVVTWTNEDPARLLFGSGFGNDFLTQSGTLQFLEGTTYDNVRSPHNWFIGIYARMGLIGIALTISILFGLVLIVFRNRRAIADDPLLSVSTLIVVAILPVATLGVVLEAPFGAVPFWWAAGIIYASRASRGAETHFRIPSTATNDFVPLSQ